MSFASFGKISLAPQLSNVLRRTVHRVYVRYFILFWGKTISKLLSGLLLTEILEARMPKYVRAPYSMRECTCIYIVMFGFIFRIPTRKNKQYRRFSSPFPRHELHTSWEETRRKREMLLFVFYHNVTKRTFYCICVRVMRIFGRFLSLYSLQLAYVKIPFTPLSKQLALNSDGLVQNWKRSNVLKSPVSGPLLRFPRTDICSGNRYTALIFLTPFNRRKRRRPIRITLFK